MTVDWKHLDQQILDAIRGLREKGFTNPTIRSVYYILGSMNVIPLTDQGYKSLDAKIVRMRKQGIIPWGFFAVKRGVSDEAGVPIKLPGKYSTTIPYILDSEWAAYWTERLKKAHLEFTLPRWYGQENLVEVWVEKDGLLGATASWLDDLGVTVRAPQGYGAWEFVHEAMRSIQAELAAQKKTSIHVLYLGDLDPSGKDIPRFMNEEALSYFCELLGVDEVEFKEIALTPEQVEEYHLPEEPEAEEVRAKIERDPRLSWYLGNYPRVFCELDAFYSLATDAARGLIREEVERLFDVETFEEIREAEIRMKANVKRIVDRQVRFTEGR